MTNNSQDIDAGIRSRSPGGNEPHRPRAPRDRGGVYASEADAQDRTVHPERYGREELEQELAPPSDPDDPASTQSTRQGESDAT